MVFAELEEFVPADTATARVVVAVDILPLHLEIMAEIRAGSGTTAGIAVEGPAGWHKK